MSIIGKLKNALGFGEADYENEVNGTSEGTTNSAAGRSAAVTPLSQRRKEEQRQSGSATHTAEKPGKEAAAAEPKIEVPEIEVVAPEAIFNTVVKVFNESLPAFLRDSVDSEAQCRYLHEALDDDMKKYVASIEEKVVKQMQAANSTERTAMRQQMEALNERSQRLEQQNAEWNEQRLSADRQKRALTQRVHDLEQKIESFAAEREQYELENKSLVNKVRALSITEKDMEALRADNEALRLQLLKARNDGEAPAEDGVEAAPVVDTAATEALQQEVEALKAQISTLEQERDKAAQEHQIVTQERDKLLEENAQLADNISTIEKRCEIADAMINDLNHKASEARMSLSKKEAELARKDEELTNVKALSQAEGDASSQQQVEELKSENQSLKEQLAEAQTDMENATTALAEFEKTLEQFESVKQAKDQRIADLKQTVSERNTRINALESENESLKAEAGTLRDEAEQLRQQQEELKQQAEDAKRSQLEGEAALRAEIDRMKQGQESHRGRRRKEAPTEIDTALDDTNWLIATPPPGTNARLDNLTDDDFGYHAPQRRREPAPDDPTQMSLFG